MNTSFAKMIAPKAAAAAFVSLCLLSSNAMANDAVVGAIIGGGAGAFVGQSIGGRDATIIGGALGAAAGVAIASDRGRTTYVERRVEYVPPPRVAYQQPVRIQPAPVYYGYGPRVRVVETPVYYVRDQPVYYVRDKHFDRHHRHDRQWRKLERRQDRHQARISDRHGRR